jgi:SAM-dependent methyltransferase
VSVIESPRPGQRGISEGLRRFVEEFPYERGPILDFVIEIAATVPAGARVLDLGAGDAPYRELFDHAEYLTSDWANSPHPGGREADIIGPADSLPVRDREFALVLCTQVLEHVPEPALVLSECFRVLEPGGFLALTAPLLWELHEEPYDYYRFTEHGLRHLLTSAGFSAVEVSPRGRAPSAIAQLLLNLRWAMGAADDGLDAARIEAREVLERLASEIGRLEPLDARAVMPLGYTATGSRP